MRADFFSNMQKKVAWTSISGSTFRGKRAGTLRKARDFLVSLPLRGVARQNGRRFRQWLDEQTSLMEKKGIDWGTARKCLNLFLRDAFYNRYLHTEFGLEPLEGLLEVPLDSQVGRFLVRNQRGNKLQEWPGLKGLGPRKNREFQEVAARVAEEEDILPSVHLDIFVWQNKVTLPPSAVGTLKKSD